MSVLTYVQKCFIVGVVCSIVEDEGFRYDLVIDVLSLFRESRQKILIQQECVQEGGSFVKYLFLN